MLNLGVRVRAFMNPNIIRIEGSKSIKDAARKMVEAGISSILVTDDRGRPIGIVTERDIVQRVISAGKNPDRRVEEIMSSPLITVGPLATFGEAAQIMIERKIKRLLVKEDENILGIITQTDVQRGMLDTFNSLLLT
jgi:signal-transduction protein with cAMP-binding, CBS, and nucleotidyltransferase domain